ncbi:hypothetical protein BME96_19065 (plasmid) [Virgibacillus halodenitrificans]|uniref:Uncharacterized protein n=1 Tax=Virgibacillus halodenitrificans TaxID=1482 RepID=A0AAC9J3Q7_VIRHA|nr:hypothetical protein [Virgibacillus halodenitrificans]APC50385.1 hypothetical protein BME96_19065 [Virgibacillus halodenitrificans]
MLRDYASLIWIMFIGIFVMVLLGIFYRIGYTQDATTLGLTETVRTSVIANADYSSRLEQGQLFILKENFEKEFKEKITVNNNVKLSENADFEFEYLENKNGSTKAIRVSIVDEDTTYQATYKVDISDS